VELGNRLPLKFARKWNELFVYVIVSELGRNETMFEMGILNAPGAVNPGNLTSRWYVVLKSLRKPIC